MRYPSRKIFIHEGLGIEARYERCKAAWGPHLLQSKKFIKENIQGENLDIVILGAGKLLDCDLASIASKARSITLVDIDPRIASMWPRSIMQVPVKGVVADVTGAFDNWREEIRRNNLFLDAPFAATQSIVPSGDVVISLNLQSQFPVLLKEMMKEEFLKYDIAADDEDVFPEPFESFWNRLSGILQKEHRNAVFNAARSTALFLYDKEFIYSYQNTVEQHAAIYTELNRPESGWKLSKQSVWEWNIAPKGEVSPEYEVTHSVCGEAWLRSED